MKNKQLKELVTSAIKLYIDNDLAFTSLDVCNYIRDTNDGDIRYGKVSKLVKMLVLVISEKLGSMYNASLITIDTESSSTLTYLYSHKDFDTEDYLARDQVSLQTLGK